MLDIDIRQKRHAGTLVLQSVRIRIPTPEIVALIGPSGCGKTTLLKIASHLDDAYEGSVRFGDSAESPELGYIFQESRLLPWLTVRDNIALVTPRDASEIETMLAQVGLEGYADAYPKCLSGGMQRRAAMVRAFINAPRYLLMDEPFTSLDHPTAQGLRALFLNLYRRNPAHVLFVTHDLSEALSMADRILFLSPKPSSIIYEYVNEEKTFEESVIEARRAALIAEHPEILSGKLA